METIPERGPGADNPRIDPGHDYEYDEAHDVPTGSLREMHGSHRVDAPSGIHVGEGGDYGYDEAHVSVLDDQSRRDSAPLSELVTDRLKHS